MEFKALTFLPLVIFVFAIQDVLAQSVDPIPLSELRVLEVARSIEAPNGYKVFDSGGVLVKPVWGASKVTVKAFVEHHGNLLLMSDWSFERLKNQKIAPNWMLVHGLKPGNQLNPDRVPASEDTGLDMYQIVFPDSNDSRAPVLSNVENSQLIYADEEWVIVGKFVREVSGGYHYLSAYRANTLRLAFQLRMINYVFSMDWSPERQQFLAVTTSGLENEQLTKWPLDEPSVVVIDLPSRRIKRLNYKSDSTDRAVWEGNQIQFEYNREKPAGVNTLDGEIVRFSGDSFSDVSITTKKVTEPIPTLQKRRKAYERAAALDLVGVTGFSEAHHTFNSKVKMDLASDEAGSLRIVRTAGFGRAVDLNLGELRIKRLGWGSQEIGELTIMNGGVVGIKHEPATLQFIGSGNIVEVDFGPFMNEKSDFGFSDEAAFVVGPTVPNSQRLSVTRVGLDGEISQTPINLSMERYDSWDLHPRRKSIVTFEMAGDGTQKWREFLWRSGEQVGEAFSTSIAKGFDGSNTRVFGESEGGWTLISNISDFATGGYTFSVVAENTVTGRTVVFNEWGLDGDEPLHLFHASDEGFDVLCSGNDKIYLYRYRENEDQATLLRKWDKNPGHGDAAFDRNGGRLLVPRENGYEVFSITREGVSKAFDLYFYGTSDFAVVLPDGFYAGSPGCESFLSLLSQNSSVDASALSLWRNRPGKVMAALGGSPDEVSTLEKVTERWLGRSGYVESKEPAPSELPSISLREQMPLRTSQSELKIPCRLTVGAAPARGVSVSVNGVEVEGTGIEDLNHQASGETWDATVNVSLSSGQNWIELTALDEKGRVGEPVRFRIIYTNDPVEAKRFVVAMGVSKYADSALDLDLAAKDAEDVAAMFLRLSGVSETKTLVITDEEAVASAISRIEEFLAQAGVDDEVIFFGAAHGVLDGNLDYVFCTHDFDPADASNTGVKLDAIVNAIRKGASRKRLILLDTCQAGAVGERDAQLLSANSGPALNVTSISRSPITTVETGMSVAQTNRYIEEMFLMPGTLKGIHIIGGSSAAGFALELDGILNGVFTSALIEALQSGKADVNGDREVSIDELKEYLENRVVELTSGVQQPSIVASEKNQAMWFPVGMP